MNAAGSSTLARPKITSIGKSRKTGPRCGVSAAASAVRTSPGMASALVTVDACRVIGVNSGTWSNSWSEPAPQRHCGARPPSTTTGEALKCALVTPETPLVTPGPAVSTARPGLPVSLATPSAANTAVCSCRVSTIGMPVRYAASYSGNT